MPLAKTSHRDSLTGGSDALRGGRIGIGLVTELHSAGALKRAAQTDTNRIPNFVVINPACLGANCRQIMTFPYPRMFTLSLTRLDVVAQHRVDLRVPSPAVEDAIVADACLQVMGLHVRPQARTQVLRSEGLADSADVVLLALDRHQKRLLDCAQINRLALVLHFAERQQIALEHLIDSLEIKSALMSMIAKYSL